MFPFCLLVLVLVAGVACADVDNAPAAAAPSQRPTLTPRDVMLIVGLLAGGVALCAVWHVSRTGRERVRRLFCPWGAQDVLLGLSVFVLLLWVVGAIARAVVPGQGHPWRDAAVMGLVGVATSLLILYYLRRRYGLLPRDIGLRFDGWPWAFVLATALLMLVLAVRGPLAVGLERLRSWMDVPPQPQQVLVQMLEVKSTLGLAVLVAMALVAAPLWEELVFRGFLQPFLARRLGGTPAIVITSVLFSAIHYSGSKLFILPVLMFPLALALAYAYHRTQRLTVPLMLHVLHNLVPVAVVLSARLAKG